MISLQTAMALKEAGLEWRPKNNDYFVIPDRGLDDTVFVISEILSFVEVLHNRQMVTFHGTAEWALDYLITSEVVWIPRESQLREILQGILTRTAQGENDEGKVGRRDQNRRSALALLARPGTYRVEFSFRDQPITFHSTDASEAYAQAVLFLLSQFPVE